MIVKYRYYYATDFRCNRSKSIYQLNVTFPKPAAVLYTMAITDRYNLHDISTYINNNETY